MDAGEFVNDIASLAQGAQQVQVVEVDTPRGSIPLAFRKNGNALELVDLRSEAEKWASAPERRKGKATAQTLQSLIDMTNRHKDISSAMFLSIKGNTASLTSIIDYHTTEQTPRFCDHRIIYEFPFSPQWLAWRGNDGQPMEQAKFAFFLEENIIDLTAATPAEDKELRPILNAKFGAPNEIMELSRGLEVRVDAKFKDVQHLDSGAAEMMFEETHKGIDGKPLKIPTAFMLAIPVFEGGDTVRIACRLRYRRESGKLFWFYKMLNVERLVRETVRAQAKAAADQTNLPLYEGAPETGA